MSSQSQTSTASRKANSGIRKCQEQYRRDKSPELRVAGMDTGAKETGTWSSFDILIPHLVVRAATLLHG